MTVYDLFVRCLDLVSTGEGDLPVYCKNSEFGPTPASGLAFTESIPADFWSNAERPNGYVLD